MRTGRQTTDRTVYRGIVICVLSTKMANFRHTPPRAGKWLKTGFSSPALTFTRFFPPLVQVVARSLGMDDYGQFPTAAIWQFSKIHRDDGDFRTLRSWPALFFVLHVLISRTCHSCSDGRLYVNTQKTHLPAATSRWPTWTGRVHCPRNNRNNWKFTFWLIRVQPTELMLYTDFWGGLETGEGHTHTISLESGRSMAV